jgi:hypothetical protein
MSKGYKPADDAQSEADEIKQALTAIADEHYSGQMEELRAAIRQRDPELLNALPELHALNETIKEFLRVNRQDESS